MKIKWTKTIEGKFAREEWYTATLETMTGSIEVARVQKRTWSLPRGTSWDLFAMGSTKRCSCGTLAEAKELVEDEIHCAVLTEIGKNKRPAA